MEGMLFVFVPVCVCVCVCVTKNGLLVSLLLLRVSDMRYLKTKIASLSQTNCFSLSLSHTHTHTHTHTL